ncbi:TRUD domain-containing protein [Entamoeba marina]
MKRQNQQTTPGKIKKIDLVRPTVAVQPTPQQRVIDYSKKNELTSTITVETKEKKIERHDNKERIIVNPTSKLKEVDVGITEFVRSGKRLSGLTKYHVSDFHVREIGLDKVVADIEEREDMRKVMQKELEELENNFDKEQWMKRLRALIGEEEGNKVEESIFGSEKRKEIIIEKVMGKEERTSVHSLIKELAYYDSTTKDGKVVIKRGKKQERTQRAKGSMIQCVMRKSNMDTGEAINKLSKVLRLGRNSINYAGTKDKRGVTCQYITIPGVSVEQIQSGLKNQLLRGISLGKYNDVKDSLRLGDLSGNEFRVVIREIDDINEAVENAKVIEKLGYINYFGLQRFGSCNGTTHLIGKALLLEHYHEACDLIMKLGNDSEKLAEAKQAYFRGDYAAAYSATPVRAMIERGILKVLVNQQKASAPVNESMFRNAIDGGVQYKTKSLYVHAYQSFIWNQIISKRFQQGNAVIKGDLIRDGSTIRAISEEEINNFKLNDVVLPLPAKGMILPNNDISAWYDDYLKIDGLSLDTFPTKVFNAMINGDYRNIVIRPLSLDYEVVNYDDISQDFVDQNGMLLKGSNGSKNGLWLRFQLPSSAYATMLFRELLKMPTDVDNQKDLSEKANAIEEDKPTDCLEEQS